MALAFTNNQGEQPPATGSTDSFWPTIWQKGLALAAFTHKGTIHVVEFAGALEASSQKRVCSSDISVFGWTGAIRRARRRLRERTFGSGGAAAQEAFTVISGSPACSTKVGMILSTGRPETAAMAFQKSSALALLYWNLRK